MSSARIGNRLSFTNAKKKSRDKKFHGQSQSGRGNSMKGERKVGLAVKIDVNKIDATKKIIKLLIRIYILSPYK